VLVLDQTIADKFKNIFSALAHRIWSVDFCLRNK